MSRAILRGHLIEGARGPMFLLSRRPPSDPLGAVLVVPPFAEEMNKCRRMVTEVALGLAERGMVTVVPDLYGTGDSGGEFVDADWAGWREDLAAASRWSAEVGHPITACLAIRLGGALALDALQTGELSPVVHSVLWQPVFDGARFLAQFLRLRIAAGLMEDRKESLADLKARLARGESVETAGYLLSGRLAHDVETLTPPGHLPRTFGRLAWFEVVREPGVSLPPGSARLAEVTSRQGVSVETQGFDGEPFWSSTEIVVNAEMVLATIAFLSQAAAREGTSRA